MLARRADPGGTSKQGSNGALTSDENHLANADGFTSLEEPVVRLSLDHHPRARFSFFLDVGSLSPVARRRCRSYAVPRLLVCCVLASSCVPRLLSAQPARVGAEFQVNTYTADAEINPSVALNSSGGFLVVWERFDGEEIFGRLFASIGGPQGNEFQVNSFSTSPPYYPLVATDDSGAFVVVWESFVQNYNIGLFGKKFDSEGVTQGSEFAVASPSPGIAPAPFFALATSPSGDFVVVWEEFDRQDTFSGIFSRQFDSTGAGVGVEFHVNSYTFGGQIDPAVAMDRLGNFVVVWESFYQDGSEGGIFAQRFDSSGMPTGNEFQVNTFTTGAQGYPEIAMNQSGNFVVVWESTYQDGSQGGISAQRFDGSGTPLGTEFQVNSYTWTVPSSRADAGAVSDATCAPLAGRRAPWRSRSTGRRVPSSWRSCVAAA